MSEVYRSVFDIIGPIMIGPSSSHTAGTVAIGRAANKIFGGIPPKVTVHYYESFAQTHRGHGTDYAIAAGIMGFKTDDPRVKSAPQIARQQGIDLRFVEEVGKSPINHPNTAILKMTDGHKQVQVAGCSIGGGMIEIRQIKFHHLTIDLTGILPLVIFIAPKKRGNEVAELGTTLKMVAPFDHVKVFHAPDCDIYVYDIENYMHRETVKRLKQKFHSIVCL